MGINTSDIKVGGGSLPKSFTPGNHVCKINNISLRWPKYLQNKGEKAYEVVLDLETKPITEEFEGWLIDSEKENGPRYLGQTGRIKSRKWPYKDGSWTKDGKTVKFDMALDILKVIKSIENECNSQFLMETSGKYDTVEEIVEAFNNAKPFKDVYMNWCIGGEQEIQDNGHPKYYMFLPKYQRGKSLFANEEKADQVLVFDKALHVEGKPSAQPVAGFSANENEAKAGGADALWDNSADDKEDPFAVDNSSNDEEDPFAVEE